MAQHGMCPIFFLKNYSTLTCKTRRASYCRKKSVNRSLPGSHIRGNFLSNSGQISEDRSSGTCLLGKMFRVHKRSLSNVRICFRTYIKPLNCITYQINMLFNTSNHCFKTDQIIMRYKISNRYVSELIKSLCICL